MHHALLITSLLFTLACSKKDDTKSTESAAKTAPAGSATPTAAGNAGATPSAPAVALSCDKVLPQALRDKYFKGATIKDDPSKLVQLPDASGAHCDIEAPVTPEMKVAPNEKTWTGEVSVQCYGGPHGQKVMDSMRETEMKMPDAAKLEIGKGAIAFATGNNGSLKQVKAWDDNSACQVHTVLPAEVHNDDLAKDLIAALPLQP